MIRSDDFSFDSLYLCIKNIIKNENISTLFRFNKIKKSWLYYRFIFEILGNTLKFRLAMKVIIILSIIITFLSLDMVDYIIENIFEETYKKDIIQIDYNFFQNVKDCNDKYLNHF